MDSCEECIGKPISSSGNTPGQKIPEFFFLHQPTNGDFDVEKWSKHQFAGNCFLLGAQSPPPNWRLHLDGKRWPNQEARTHSPGAAVGELATSWRRGWDRKKRQESMVAPIRRRPCQAWYHRNHKSCKAASKSMVSSRRTLVTPAGIVAKARCSSAGRNASWYDRPIFYGMEALRLWGHDSRWNYREPHETRARVQEGPSGETMCDGPSRGTTKRGVAMPRTQVSKVELLARITPVCRRPTHNRVHPAEAPVTS